MEPRFAGQTTTAGQAGFTGQVDIDRSGGPLLVRWVLLAKPRFAGQAGISGQTLFSWSGGLFWPGGVVGQVTTEEGNAGEIAVHC